MTKLGGGGASVRGLDGKNVSSVSKPDWDTLCIQCIQEAVCVPTLSPKYKVGEYVSFVNFYPKFGRAQRAKKFREIPAGSDRPSLHRSHPHKLSVTCNISSSHEIPKFRFCWIDFERRVFVREIEKFHSNY